MPTRIAVLASGRGSNLRALYEHLAEPSREGVAQIKLVLSDHPDSGALAFAQEKDMATATLDMGTGHSVGLAMLLEDRRIDLIVLAGYLRLVPSGVVRAYRGRILNTHPALLPAFGGRGMYGDRVHEAVLSAGVRVSGATVHFVDEAYDQGAIIAQWPVPVFPDDTVATLATRVLRVEHLLLPRAVEAAARGRVRLDESGRVRGAGRHASAHAAFGLAARDDAALATEISASLATD